MLTSKTILCDSNIPWQHQRYSKQHLMARFARSNRVLFVNPPVGPARYIKDTLGLMRERGSVAAPTDTSGVTVYTPFHAPLRDRSALCCAIDPWLQLAQIKALVNAVPKEALVLFLGNPSNYRAATSLRGAFCTVYHCSDAFTSFFSGSLRERMGEWETTMLSSVDLVIASSAALLDRCRQHNGNSHLVEHGVDEGFFFERIR
ncbi:MAG: hypothetical protein QME74_02425, partial [Candidatus Edwardsbacteria bacterium]|nr:hypothetical protein [Candidatus Edwardsbacteria bacterium]